jgi:S-(hydroxymethyl)glutathione dehydrogenase / alcohol dehydrogenase
MQIKTMQAAILAQTGQPLIIDQVSLPDRLEIGQVLVKVHYTGICGSQIGEIDAVKGPDKFLPHLLGHEGVGTVVETGPGVNHIQVGQVVVLHWREGLGLPAKPPVYRWQNQRLNAGWVTTFNEYAIVAENRLTAIPADFPLELAPLFGCAVTTGLGVIENNAQLKVGESIVILGAGGVGLSMVQAACLVTGHPIIGIDLQPEKLALAKQLGADFTFSARDPNWQAELAKLLPQGADVVIENTGLPAMIEYAYSLSKPKGRVVLVGVPRAGAQASLYTLPLHFGKVLTGSHGGDAQPQKDIPACIALIKAGKLDLRPLVTEILPFAEINTAIERLRRGEQIGRCVLRISEA